MVGSTAELGTVTATSILLMSPCWAVGLDRPESTQDVIPGSGQPWEKGGGEVGTLSSQNVSPSFVELGRLAALIGKVGDSTWNLYF